MSENTPVEEQEMLTPQKALHSIAVELARHNQIAQIQLQIQNQLLKAIKKVVDSTESAKSHVGEMQLESMRMFRETMAPLMQFVLQPKLASPDVSVKPALPSGDDDDRRIVGRIVPATTATEIEVEG